jgi:BirA family biotin operon repressor/biotin-[acetyl-CoA-carboxylase] ligase
MPDKNIYLSIILKPYHDKFSIPKFEAVTCACVHESIKNLCSTECQIKWPNDLFINNKKVASISCEEIKIKNKIEGIIISTSINVNDFDEESENNQNNKYKIEDNNVINKEFNQESLELKEETDSVIYNEFHEIKKNATSIKAETKIKVDRDQLISQILNNFERYNEELINSNNTDTAINICNTYSLLNGNEISINKYKKKSFKKLMVKNIDSEGWLITINEKGNEEIINSGEITIRYELQKN